MLVAACDIRAGQPLTTRHVIGKIAGRWAFAVGPIEPGERDYRVGPLGVADRDYREGEVIRRRGP